MFKEKNVTVKRTTLMATLFLVPSMLTVLFWFISSYAANGVHTDAQLAFLEIQQSVFLWFSLIAVVLFAISLFKKCEGESMHKNVRAEILMLFLLSILVSLIYIWFNL